jgi:hypothetical protein
VQVKGFKESADGNYYLSDELHDGLPFYKKEGSISHVSKFNCYVPSGEIVSGSIQCQKIHVI